MYNSVAQQCLLLNMYNCGPPIDDSSVHSWRIVVRMDWESFCHVLIQERHSIPALVDRMSASTWLYKYPCILLTVKVQFIKVYVYTKEEQLINEQEEHVQNRMK